MLHYLIQETADGSTWRKPPLSCADTVSKSGQKMSSNALLILTQGKATQTHSLTFLKITHAASRRAISQGHRDALSTSLPLAHFICAGRHFIQKTSRQIKFLWRKPGSDQRGHPGDSQGVMSMCLTQSALKCTLLTYPVCL